MLLRSIDTLPFGGGYVRETSSSGQHTRHMEDEADEERRFIGDILGDALRLLEE